MSVNTTVSDDRDSYPARQGTRQQVDNLVKDLSYFFTHRPAWQVAAAAVAPPVVAVATVTTQIKTTATSQLMVNGVLTSLTATDPFVLAADIAIGDPNTLAIGSVRKWQVCWDATNATTKGTVRPSNDVVIASSPLGTSASALAQCRWTSLPPLGTVIVGVVSIVNVTNIFTPGTTLLGAAGVTTTAVDGPTQDCLLASLLSP